MADRNTLYLGIDGGGTTCRARLTDAAGAALGEATAGSANVTLGVPVAAAAIREASAKAFAAAGLGEADYGRAHAGFGLAGANVPELADAVRALPFPYASVAVASDAVAACLGAHGGADGAILILGTGSQGLALVGGRATAIGGWGFQISDEGSGALLGRAAIRAAILAADELGPHSDLTRAVMARLGDPARAVIWAGTAKPRDYGSFVPEVFGHRLAGDPVAIQLVDEAVAAVGVMIDRLVTLGAARVVLMGGLAAPYRPWLPARFENHLAEAKGDALDGAITMARRGEPGAPRGSRNDEERAIGARP